MRAMHPSCLCLLVLLERGKRRAPLLVVDLKRPQPLRVLSVDFAELREVRGLSHGLPLEPSHMLRTHERIAVGANSKAVKEVRARRGAARAEQMSTVSARSAEARPRRLGDGFEVRRLAPRAGAERAVRLDG